MPPNSYRIPISYWLTESFLNAAEAYQYLLSLRNVRKGYSLLFFFFNVVEDLSSVKLLLLRLDNPRSFNLSSQINFFRPLIIRFAFFSSWAIFLEMQAPKRGHSKSSDFKFLLGIGMQHHCLCSKPFWHIYWVEDLCSFSLLQYDGTQLGCTQPPNTMTLT